MSKARLEAFSDGVIAIIITIMVLELRPPEGYDLAALMHLSQELCAYILSFVILGIYWNNHHVLVGAMPRVSAGVLWANLHLLFWLSLLPFLTRWTGESHFASLPTALYGVVLVLAALAYVVLQNSIIASQGPDSKLALAVGNDRKGKLSLFLYAIAIPLAFYFPWAASVLYAVVVLIWLIPDRRIETRLT